MKLHKLLLRLRLHHLLLVVIAGLVAIVMFSPIAISSRANAALVELRSVELSDGTGGATGVNYKFDFTTVTSASVGSITFEVCTNYLYNPSYVCNPPPGFDASATSLSSQSGVSDFSLDSTSIASKLIISRASASVISPQPLTFEFSNITNPTNTGSYYVHIATFASTDATGPEIDYGDVVFALNDDIEIVTEVPPYLIFCVGVSIDGFNCGTTDGGFISFGELSTTATRAATSQMLAVTNAGFGYSITLAGSTMTAGNNVIPAMTSGGPSLIGTSQFGLNARFNTGPTVGTDPVGPGLATAMNGYETANSFKFNSGDIIVTSPGSDDYRKYTISYIVNRDKNQAPGRYVATISYICLANF